MLGMLYTFMQLTCYNPTTTITYPAIPTMPSSNPIMLRPATGITISIRSCTSCLLTAFFSLYCDVKQSMLSLVLLFHMILDAVPDQTSCFLLIVLFLFSDSFSLLKHVCSYSKTLMLIQG